MSKRPWMPLYIGDYLADTTHLMATESGAYMHLLMHYWRDGPLPDNNARLCRIAKVWPPHWKRIRSTIEPYFDLTKRPGFWSHHRADSEISKADEISNKRKGAAQQMLSKRSANAEQMLTQSQSHSKKEGFAMKGREESNGSSAWTTADRIARIKAIEENQLRERDEHAAFLARRK